MCPVENTCPRASRVQCGVSGAPRRGGRTVSRPRGGGLAPRPEAETPACRSQRGVQALGSSWGTVSPLGALQLPQEDTERLTGPLTGHWRLPGGGDPRGHTRGCREPGWAAAFLADNARLRPAALPRGPPCTSPSRPGPGGGGVSAPFGETSSSPTSTQSDVTGDRLVSLETGGRGSRNQPGSGWVRSFPSASPPRSGKDSAVHPPGR